MNLIQYFHVALLNPLYGVCSSQIVLLGLLLEQQKLRIAFAVLVLPYRSHQMIGSGLIRVSRGMPHLHPLKSETVLWPRYLEGLAFPSIFRTLTIAFLFHSI